MQWGSQPGFYWTVSSCKALKWLKMHTFLPPISWTLKFEEVSPWTFDEDGFEKLSHESLVVMVKRTAAEFETVPMRGVIIVIWRAVPVKFVTGIGWHTCMVKHGELFRQSSKQGICLVQYGRPLLQSSKRKDLWCIFGTLVQHELAHARGEIWRVVPAKFETRMCEMKILRSEDL